jgi:hypothetical protein
MDLKKIGANMCAEFIWPGIELSGDSSEHLNKNPDFIKGGELLEGLLKKDST